MNIWQALDLYRDKYARPESKWACLPITVDKQTNRMVVYALGNELEIEDISELKFEDGSIDYADILKQHLGDLDIFIILNNRNNVMDIYKGSGLFPEMNMPLAMHISAFVREVQKLLRVPLNAPDVLSDTVNEHDLSKVKGNGNFTKSKETLIKEAEAKKMFAGFDMTESLESDKYSSEVVRKTALFTFVNSGYYKPESNKKSENKEESSEQYVGLLSILNAFADKEDEDV